jgi:hypothetical protein
VNYSSVSGILSKICEINLNPKLNCKGFKRSSRAFFSVCQINEAKTLALG